jgi:hypothetical protein
MTLRTALVASVLLCLVIGALMIWRHHSSQALNSAFITVAHGECSVQHLQDTRDLLRSPRIAMACKAVAEYLSHEMQLPVDAAVGISINDEKDPDAVRVIADTRALGYTISIVGPIRRVVFPTGKDGPPSGE